MPLIVAHRVNNHGSMRWIYTLDYLARHYPEKFERNFQHLFFEYPEMEQSLLL